ncbi:lark [Gracilaria domingensis]|nr:lark [Gracilaria domingensis]
MLVLQQPPLLDGAPPQDLPRVFVGNLTEQILDSSLHQLFSRFGTINDYARSKCSTFAHISLEVDEASATKCVSCLNHVKWFGTSLRVEKARQHYLNRLRDEWKQQPCETQYIDEDIHEGHGTTPKPPFHNMPKGKHIRFSFPDEPLRTPPDSSPSQITKQREEPITKPVRTKSSASVAKQNSLQTTLSLFGLSATQHENQLRQAKRFLSELPSSGRCNKRPRSTPDRNGEINGSIQTSHGNDVHHDKNPPISLPISKDSSLDSKGKAASPDGRAGDESYSIEHAEAVEDDPSRIDIERERSSYLHVFRSMFLDQDQQLEKSEVQNGTRGDMFQKNLFTRYRRAALYTTLQTPGMDTLPLPIVKSTGSNSKSETSNDPREGFARDRQQDTNLTVSYRHAALYKKL